VAKAYGFVEVSGVVAAVDALDIMLKTAQVEFATWERRLGGRLVTIVVTGEVSACNEAVENAVAKALGKPVSTGVLPNPHPEVVKLIELSSQRWKKAWAQNQAKEKEREKAEGEESYLYTV